MLPGCSGKDRRPVAPPAAMGISIVVVRLTLAQVAEVRILDPQPLFCFT